MADAAVNILFQNLNAFLLEETSLCQAARSNFEEIKKELDGMQSFLEDADKTEDVDEGLRIWVGQVRDESYYVEDIIYEFARHMNGSQIVRCKHFLLESIHFPKIIFHGHKLASQLQELNSQIASISKIKDRYQLNRTEDRSSSYNAAERCRCCRETLLFMDDDKIVGLEQKVNELIEWRDDPKITVVSKDGMGGIGKTTLVAQAYKNERVKRHFDYLMWVSVLQSHKIKELLQEIIKDLFIDKKDESLSDLHNVNSIQLLQMVNEYLDMK